MKKLIFILMAGSLFSEEPAVTIIGKGGTFVTGTIQKFNPTIPKRKGFLDWASRWPKKPSNYYLIHCWQQKVALCSHNHSTLTMSHGSASVMVDVR